jgi:hypothetical protein
MLQKCSNTQANTSLSDWHSEAKRLLKAELARRDISHQQLVFLLSDIGVSVTKASLDNKLSRGTFSAAFFIQCLAAISCPELRLAIELDKFKLNGSMEG